MVGRLRLGAVSEFETSQEWHPLLRLTRRNTSNCDQVDIYITNAAVSHTLISLNLLANSRRVIDDLFALDLHSTPHGLTCQRNTAVMQDAL